jgi:hypothetical protein
MKVSSSVVLQSWKYFRRLTHRRFLNIMCALGRIPLDEWSARRKLGIPTQDNTAQKDEDKHPCLRRDLNHDLIVQAVKAYASDRSATGIGMEVSTFTKI